jgi:shikimate dehydrogenase
MKRACVIGWPIEHSRSPLIHGTWLKTYGIDGSYTKEAVKPEDVQTFFASIEQNGWAGCSVTVPHKEAAFAAAAVKDESAVAVGAANTLWLADGKLHCANTDTYGFMTHLDLSAPQWKAHDAPVLIIGAGGAARAIVYGFLAAGIGRVIIANRSRARAEQLAQYFGSKVHVAEWDKRNEAAHDASVIVNTTTLGMKGVGDPEIDFSCAWRGTVAADIVYVPLETQFLASARAHGLTGVDGLGMLLHQAVPGFEKWFGVRPQVTQELRALVVADIEGR